MKSNGLNNSHSNNINKDNSSQSVDTNYNNLNRSISSIEWENFLVDFEPNTTLDNFF